MHQWVCRLRHQRHRKPGDGRLGLTHPDSDGLATSDSCPAEDCSVLYLCHWNLVSLHRSLDLLTSYQRTLVPVKTLELMGWTVSELVLRPVCGSTTFGLSSRKIHSVSVPFFSLQPDDASKTWATAEPNRLTVCAVDAVQAGIWSYVEIVTGITCASLPALRSLVRLPGSRRGGTSGVGGGGTHSSSSVSRSKNKASFIPWSTTSSGHRRLPGDKSHGMDATGSSRDLVNEVDFMETGQMKADDVGGGGGGGGRKRSGSGGGKLGGHPGIYPGHVAIGLRNLDRENTQNGGAAGAGVGAGAGSAIATVTAAEGPYSRHRDHHRLDGDEKREGRLTHLDDVDDDTTDDDNMSGIGRAMGTNINGIGNGGVHENGGGGGGGGGGLGVNESRHSPPGIKVDTSISVYNTSKT